MNELIEREIQESIAVKQALMSQGLDQLRFMADKIVQAFERGGKMLVFGNGGSAADAQHLACEMVGRFKIERRGLACIALTTDTSILTAVANDYHFDRVFARQIEALAGPGDCVMAISTSGNSPNVLKALDVARDRGCTLMALGGKGGGEMATRVDHAVIVPSDNTQRIQECHILIIHSLCLLIDRHFAAGE